MINATSFETGFDRNAWGEDREAVLAGMMVDQPPAQTRDRIRRLRRQMSRSQIERLHDSNVAGLERLYKVAWRAGR